MRNHRPPGSFLPRIREAGAPVRRSGKPRFALDEGTRVVLADILAERQNLHRYRGPFIPNCAVLLFDDPLGVARRLVDLLARELEADHATFNLPEIGLLEAALDRIEAQTGGLSLMHLDLGGLASRQDTARVVRLVERACRIDHLGMLFASTPEEAVDQGLARAFDLVLSLYPVRQ